MNDRLKELLAEVFSLRLREIVPELTKEDVGSWDSLKQMDLVVSLEREYNIELEIVDIIRMVTVSDIIAVLTDKGVNLEA
ncbi:acyl carrier protein [Desulfovibrio litoralis]|uniref:Acyl carrier protein n=1 Tax=Desulfovibrio litoralis DSM 11393 TaxID=1121455 RepID=A0A1M7T229_9BACT|nr:acyl carrier protein [Desulfovibrio litoralis]SHN64810.1 acyl carrier protein [Desulfovibrio litoralis DSM 11393]